MNKLAFFDSETSGVNNSIHQMLSFAMVITDLDLNPMQKLYYTLVLDQKAVVDPKALSINKIDPFSKEWINNSITEKELRGELSSFCQSYTDSDTLFLAYNAPFDRGFVRELYLKGEIDYKRVMKGNLIDPLIGAKHCTKNGLILTDLKQGSKGSWYKSSTLEDVSKALKTQYHGQAHNALNDCYTLAPTTKKVYELQFKMDFKKTFMNNANLWKIS